MHYRRLYDSLAQYDAFFILITGDVTCEMPVA